MRRAPVLALAATLTLAGLAFAQEAPAKKPAPKPEPPPRVIEFADADTIRDGDESVHFYRVNSVQPALLIAELNNWKAPSAKIAAVGVAFPLPKGAGSIQNVLRIQTDDANWLVLKRVLEMIDTPSPQVYVEARVVELTYDDELRLGVEASNIRTDSPVGDLFFKRADVSFSNVLDSGDVSKLTFGSADKFVKFDYVLQMAERGAHAEVLTQPAIMASQGQLATIKVVDKEPIVKQTVSGNNISATTEFTDVGVTLMVTPLLIGRDYIRASLQPEVSRVAEFRVTSTSTDRAVINPVISTRSATTVVEVPDGETIVISGLVQTVDGESEAGIPLLKDIPYVGRLFGSTSTRKQKTEIVFFVTLTIVRPGELRLIVPPGEKARTEELVESSADAD